MADQSSVNLNPKSFRDIPLCELCFEDALKAGFKRCSDLPEEELKETSVRIHVAGLLKWYKVYGKTHQRSVLTLIRDISWYCASLCTVNRVLSMLVEEYYSLLKDIAEQTSYTDLADRMDQSRRIKEIAHGGEVMNVLIPREVHGIIADCATAVGTTFSVMLQLGLGIALASNREGLYQSWSRQEVLPLLKEVVQRGESRLLFFEEIRNSVEYRSIRTPEVQGEQTAAQEIASLLSQ